MVLQVMPDIRFTIEDAVESGDTIWVRVRAQGTATGPWPRGVPDRFTMLAQTGVLDRLG